MFKNKYIIISYSKVYIKTCKKKRILYTYVIYGYSFNKPQMERKEISNIVKELQTNLTYSINMQLFW